MSNSEKETKFCRICMEDTSSGALISPCRCSGSLSHIHEECLKTWLASKHSDMEDSTCEICKTKFLMKFLIKKTCKPGEIFREGLAQCLFLPLLLAVLSILFFIMFVLIQKLIDDPGNAQDQGFAIGLVLTCGISIFSIIFLVAKAFRDVCVSRTLEEWHIYDQHFTDEHIHEGEHIEYNIGEVPDYIRIGGKRVKTVHNNKDRIQRSNSNIPSYVAQSPALVRRNRFFTINHNRDNADLN